METVHPRLKFSFVAAHVFLPVFIGGLIYLLWRSPSLLMFSWVDATGLSDALFKVRELTSSFRSSIPDFLLYSLPNALWVYSLTAFMVWYWYGSRSHVKYFWFCVGPILGAGVEVGQFFILIPGTFDVVDLITALFASLLPVIFIKFRKG